MLQMEDEMRREILMLRLRQHIARVRKLDSTEFWLLVRDLYRDEGILWEDGYR